jgi:two-component system, NarL family, sensor kinase
VNKIIPLLFLLYLSSCKNISHKSDTSLPYLANKVKSFSLINSDSIKYYNNILQKNANKAIPAENALMQFCDGIYQLTSGLHNKALVNFKEAIAIFEKEKNDSLLFYSLVAMGSCHKLSGNADEAIRNYIKAIPAKETTSNKNLFSICYGNLAETFLLKNDMQNASKYLLLAKSYEPYGSRTYVALMHMQANLFGMNNVIDSALLTDYAGLSLAVKNNYTEKLTPFYDNMAQCFVAKKNYDSAAYYFKKCVAIDSLNGRLQLMADTYAQMVNLYAAKNEPENMRLVAKHAYSQCDSTQYLRGKYMIFDGLSNYYTKTQNWKSLAEAKDSLQQIYKRLIKKETEAKIAQYNVEYETSKKEQLITAQQNSLQKARYLTLFISIIALLLCLSIFALVRNYKIKKAMAVNDAIQLQNDKNVKAVFESEQTERIRIARDLHDSIGQKLSVLKMYLNNRENDAAKTPNLLDETIQEVRNISHNLLPEELNFGLHNAIKSDIEKIENTGNFKVNTQLEDEAFEKISLLTSLNIVRIFREILSNLVKHCKATEIDIHVFMEQNIFYLHVKDNGIGIPSKAIEDSKGIGWKNIFTRINLLKGTINIEKITPGTSIQIKIPIP